MRTTPCPRVLAHFFPREHHLLSSPCLRASVVNLPLPEPPHPHSYLHRIEPRIQRPQSRIRYVQIQQLHTPVIFRPENVRSQSRTGSEVHFIRISRDVVIAEHHSAPQRKIRRQPPPPLKIPL